MVPGMLGEILKSLNCRHPHRDDVACRLRIFIYVPKREHFLRSGLQFAGGMPGDPVQHHYKLVRLASLFAQDAMLCLGDVASRPSLATLPALHSSRWPGFRVLYRQPWKHRPSNTRTYPFFSNNLSFLCRLFAAMLKSDATFAPIKMDVVSLIEGDYAAAAALIAMGVLLGKASALQLSVMTVLSKPPPTSKSSLLTSTCTAR